jgi:hypothetical protein
MAAERAVNVPAASKSNPGRLRILAIGVNEAGDPFFPRLKWAEDDARALAAALGTGTARVPERVTMVGAAATREAVRAALARLARESSPQDDVVVYFSGHGTLAVSTDGRLERVLVLAGTTRSAPLRTGLTVAFLRDLLEAIPARRKAAIIAACHSGAGKSKVDEEVLALLRGQKGNTSYDDRSEGVVVLAAAAREEAAREDDALRGDVYTHFLREGVARGDLNGDGSVDVLEAHEHARRRTLAFTGGRQRPSLEASVLGEGEVVLAGRAVRKGAPMLQAATDAMRGLGLKANGADKGVGPQGVVLEPGRNVVELYAEGHEDAPIARYVVEARQGETLTFSDLTRPMPWRLGIGSGFAFPASKASERLLGSARLTAHAMGEVRRDALTLSVGVETTTSTERDFASGVSGRMTLNAFPLRVGGLFPLGGGVEAGPFAEAFHERQNLRLTDAVSGEGARRDAQGWGLGVGGVLRLPMAWRFEQEISLGYRHFSTPYGVWGVARTHRVTAAWTALFALGRYARRIP